MVLKNFLLNRYFSSYYFSGVTNTNKILPYNNVWPDRENRAANCHVFVEITAVELRIKYLREDKQC